MPDTADEFLRAVEEGTADRGAQIAIWHLVHTLGGRAKIDIASPNDGWSLEVQPTPDARYVALVAHCSRRR